MAAIDLSNAILPTTYLGTTASTWQELKLPPSVRVTLTFSSATGIFAMARNGDPASPEEPADGGAVGSHYQTVGANEKLTFRIRADSTNPSGQSIFVASSSGTPAYIVFLEHLES